VNASGWVVVDANVLAKLFVEEALSENARALVSGQILAMAPDFIAVEVANVFRKKIRQGELTENEALLALEQVPDLVSLLPVTPLTPAALSISVTHHRSFYDSLYVALALREGCQFVTADEKLINALHSHYPDTMVWLGEVALS
jgi:predicted nucleic acid-binding protein